VSHERSRAIEILTTLLSHAAPSNRDAPETSLAHQAELSKRFKLLSSKIKTLGNKRYFAGDCGLPKNRNV
jgi:hypothetical protein